MTSSFNYRLWIFYSRQQILYSIRFCIEEKSWMNISIIHSRHSSSIELRYECIFDHDYNLDLWSLQSRTMVVEHLLKTPEFLPQTWGGRTVVLMRSEEEVTVAPEVRDGKHTVDIDCLYRTRNRRRKHVARENRGCINSLEYINLSLLLSILNDSLRNV